MAGPVLLALSAFVMAIGLALREHAFEGAQSLALVIVRTLCVTLVAAAGAFAGDALAIALDPNAIQIGPQGMTLTAIGIAALGTSLAGRVKLASLVPAAFVLASALALFASQLVSDDALLPAAGLLTGAGAMALASLFVLGARRPGRSSAGALGLAALGTLVFLCGWTLRHASEIVGLPEGAVREATMAAVAGLGIAALVGTAGTWAALAILRARAGSASALTGAIAGAVSLVAAPLAPIEVAASLGALAGLACGLALAFLRFLRLDDVTGTTGAFLVGGLSGLLLLPQFAPPFAADLAPGLLLALLALVSAFLLMLTIQIVVGLRPRTEVRAR